MVWSFSGLKQVVVAFERVYRRCSTATSTSHGRSVPVFFVSFRSFFTVCLSFCPLFDR